MMKGLEDTLQWKTEVSRLLTTTNAFVVIFVAGTN